MDDDKKPKTKFWLPILSAVIIAVLVGGSAPWWVKEFISKDDQATMDTEQTTTTGSKDTEVVGGPIDVRLSVNPVTISYGDVTELVVQVISSRNTPIAGANVVVSAGGGVFLSSGSTTATGTTDASGSFRTTWRMPDPAAQGYGLGVTVSKPGFSDGTGECMVYLK
jgi:hypothetical protein